VTQPTEPMLARCVCLSSPSGKPLRAMAHYRNGIEECSPYRGGVRHALGVGAVPENEMTQGERSRCEEAVRRLRASLVCS
jgi:hypothetical protein